jgi:pimeloyl-ACP methyl ester carboxylesterase
MGLRAEADAVVAAHRAAMRRFAAAGVQSGVLEAGEPGAPPVLCLHGVPTSAFLYRKVIIELAQRGFRGLAFDLPGLGVADRPADFDYTWTGLGRFAAAAVDALGLDRFHLVVHDIGGPVGFELTARMPARVLSLTILNTLVAVGSFRRPWVMEPLAHRVIGPLWLASMRPRLFLLLMRRLGVEHHAQVSDAELLAYLRLLLEGDGRDDDGRGDDGRGDDGRDDDGRDDDGRDDDGRGGEGREGEGRNGGGRNDGGQAFLRIMRGFERTAEKDALYRSVVGDHRRPRQVLWGALDPTLRLKPMGQLAADIAGVPAKTVPGRHFLQEDNAPAIAEAVAALVSN